MSFGNMCLIKEFRSISSRKTSYLCFQYFEILLSIISSTIGFGIKLDPSISTNFRSLEEPVLINFHKRINFTRSTPQHLYLPPEIASNPLPEVIDNRLKSSSWVDFLKLSEPDFSLQTPFKADAKDRFYKRPNSDKTKKDAISNSNGFDSKLVKVNKISCKNSGKELYFRASLILLSNMGQPIIENDGNDVNCQIEKLTDEYKIELNNNQFWNCGVVDCSTESGSSYCLSLRFPVISGLKLKEDLRMTLQCRAQDKIVSHVKKISLNTLDTRARMTPRVETGGYKNDFQTDIALYRKTYTSGNVFNARLESGGTVLLGEEILLRALVRDNDGWQYSKINDVTVYFVERKRQKKIMNSLWILDANGCLNPQVRVICSRQQYRVSSLESYLLFQAFMFQNMKENDEMVLSVKVTGCLDEADCILNCSTDRVRTKRSFENSRNQTIKWEDDIAFKVVLPKEMKEQSVDLHIVVPYALSALILLTVGIVICLIKDLGRKYLFRYNFN